MEFDDDRHGDPVDAGADGYGAAHANLFTRGYRVGGCGGAGGGLR
jgi:hypothetical protein